MRRVYLPIIALVVLAVCLIPSVGRADDNQQCFGDVPGISNCIQGRFLAFWRQNGGLPVFGYPITPVTTEQTAEGNFQVQYFQRNRFEAHPEKAPPYDVLLGRLGDDRLHQQGRNWQDFGQGENKGDCLFFAQTKHTVCDLIPGNGFKTYWQSHGLQDPALPDAYGRSLALFGLPLSELTAETNLSGQTVLTQWFERTRFEYHLENPRENLVLLGLLGNEIRTSMASTPPGLPTQGPLPSKLTACAGVQLGSNGVAVPNCVNYGESLQIDVLGYEPNQEISYTIERVDGGAISQRTTIRVNEHGNSTIDVSTSNFNGAQLVAGDYRFRAADTSGQNRTAEVPFRVLP